MLKKPITTRLWRDYQLSSFSQYSLFFPLVLVMLAASVFYIEYRNGTYIDWISFGYSKRQLVASKLIMAFILALTLVLIDFIILIIGLFCQVQLNWLTFTKMATSFWLFSLIAMLINIPLGALIINLTRNAITTSVFSIILMIVNAIFMAAPFGYYLPSVFAYRLGLLPISKSDFFDNLKTALTIGSTFAGLAILILFVAAIVQFSWRRKIEN